MPELPGILKLCQGSERVPVLGNDDYGMGMSVLVVVVEAIEV